jgi:hypothetical protein
MHGCMHACMHVSMYVHKLPTYVNTSVYIYALRHMIIYIYVCCARIINNTT